jgi:hypothetical protein
MRNHKQARNILGVQPPSSPCCRFYLRREGSSSAACLLHRWDGMGVHGGEGRRSRAEETLKVMPQMVAMMPAAISVLRSHP